MSDFQYMVLKYTQRENVPFPSWQTSFHGYTDIHDLMDSHSMVDKYKIYKVCGDVTAETIKEISRLRSEYQDKRELAEYQRLKAKFEGK